MMLAGSSLPPTLRRRLQRNLIHLTTETLNTHDITLGSTQDLVGSQCQCPGPKRGAPKWAEEDFFRVPILSHTIEAGNVSVQQNRFLQPLRGSWMNKSG